MHANPLRRSRVIGSSLFFLVLLLLGLYSQAQMAPGQLSEGSEVPAAEFFLPNAFTPNGDGNNDQFRGLSGPIVDARLWVYDRYGQTLYSGSLSSGWDGNRFGAAAPEGVYFFTVEGRYPAGGLFRRTGSLVLLR